MLIAPQATRRRADHPVPEIAGWPSVELERFAYERGGYTDQIWAAAGFGQQRRRYWIDSAEIGRRLGILNQRYGQAGMAAATTSTSRHQRRASS